MFPIASIGASAGGLAATIELLRALGPRPGIGMVVVHHLDPAHESELVDILSRSITLPIVTACDGARVEPNHAYVVPPNAGLSICDGILRLTPRIESGGLHLPIDRFFQSLAADCRRQAVGIVLSGTGADGTAGVQAIRAEGGITFAQDASAEYQGMPASAVRTGCVDFVLSPTDIAKELLRIGQNEPEGPADEDARAFSRIVLALSDASGIDFANYKRSTLERRMRRRVVVSGLNDLSAYADLVANSAAESRTLCEEVLIHVTSFFRDPEMFEALKTTVFPQLMEDRPRGAEIRVWVPGCATGEEVYSIVISLLEHLSVDSAGTMPAIKLFGTDVSQSTIEKARMGKYPTSIEHDVSPVRLERFFCAIDGGYQIRRNVRDMVVFAKQDATRDPPFAGMDLISCRNLLIYLGSSLQERLLPVFHYALRVPGFLVLGSSETVRSFPGFASVDAKNRIYARTSATPRMVLDSASWALRPTSRYLHTPFAPPTEQAEVHREADRLVLAEFAPPGVIVADDLSIVQFRGQTGRFLDPSPGVPTFDLLRMVREDLRLTLRSTIDEARAKERAVRASAASGAVDIEVIPFRIASAAQRFFIVLFRESLPREVQSATALDAPASTAEDPLRQELASTRAYLQSVIEQLEATNEELKTANEEIVSSNEELRSTNEELQMAKEELQSTNDELEAINTAMSARNVEANRLNDDLTNVLSSVEVPIILLGRDSTVRRFTPAAAQMFHLTLADIGRPVTELEPPTWAIDLSPTIAEVLQRLRPLTRTGQDETGRWYQLTVRPYVTRDNRIDGTVVTLFDIDAVKKAAQVAGEVVLARTETSFRDMLQTAAAVIIMTDDGRIIFANERASIAFGYSVAEMIGTAIDALLPELGHSPSDVAQAGRRRDGSKFPVEVAHSPMRLESGSLIVYFISDITRHHESDRKLRDHQEALRQMAFDSALSEDRERRRIAVDLHDRIGQSLALAQIKLTSVRETIGGAARSAVDLAVELLAQSLGDTRNLIFDLSPPILHDLGIKEALSWLADDLAKDYGMQIALADDGADKALDDAVASILFRAIRELLMNVFKHAHSTTASVSLRRVGDQLNIDVEDPGVGFDATTRPARGFGLLSIREQIGRLGGTLEIVSAAHQGTCVHLHVPLSKEKAT